MVVRLIQARTRTTAVGVASSAQSTPTARPLAAMGSAPQCASQAGRTATVIGRMGVKPMLEWTPTTVVVAVLSAQPTLTAPPAAAMASATLCATQAGRTAMVTGRMAVKLTQARIATIVASVVPSAQPTLTAPPAVATVSATQCATQGGRTAITTGRTGVRRM